jgi:hypothetical protein
MSNELSVLTNDFQAMIVTVDPWPVLESKIICLSPEASGVYVFSEDGIELGVAPFSSTISLISAKELFLGSVRNGEVVEDCQVMARLIPGGL